MRTLKTSLVVVLFVSFLCFGREACGALTLFGATGSGGALSTLYRIDPTSGAGTAVGPVGYSITGLAFDPTTGILYASESNRGNAAPRLFTINTLTGAGTPVGFLTTIGDAALADITFDSAGNLFGFAEPGADDLYSVNKATGLATYIGNSPGSAVTALAFDSHDTLYLLSGGFLQTLSPITGLSTGVVGSAAMVVGMGMDFDEHDTLYAIRRMGTGESGARSLVTVNKSTAAATVIGATVPGLDSLAFQPAVFGPVVPEPASLVVWLLLSLTLGAGCWRRCSTRRTV